jgi:diaminopimelate epimerase
MKIRFTKMHGAGNDFVIIENLSGNLDLSSEQIIHLCDRRYGIGADGLLLLETVEDQTLDARMLYYNADGFKAEMCGNGARCFTAFGLANGLGKDGCLRFLTDAGPITATTQNNLYTIEMTPAHSIKLNIKLDLTSGSTTVHSINTGVPHAICFVEDVSQIDIRSIGAEIRNHPFFAPAGANANFAQLQEGASILLRTYERGVENETLACGTGATAVGIIAHLLHQSPKPISLKVAGEATLSVNFDVTDDTVHNITLTGPAVSVFEGTIDI